MVTRLIAFSVLPLAALLLSAAYAVRATWSLRDWRPALFTILLVLMSVHQANEVGVYLSSGVATASRGFGEYPETGVNLLAGVAVISVLRLVDEERRLSEELADTLDEVRALRRENDRLEEFASVVSHDLRSPLNTARGYVQLARDEDDPERLAAVERALDRMTTIVDDSLTLARRADTVETREPVAVAALVEECWAVVETDEATLDVASFDVQADPDRLRHVFENLFRNAVQHGGEDVTVTVGPLDDGEFYVADDGPGVSAEDREAVFELGHTTAADGTGFGLAIVQRVAAAHGWAVSVTESDDGGARFEFRSTESDASPRTVESTAISEAG
ncbi:sensor histidine kinase [Halobaculum sp. MBLA0147]|uniref:sensor histidine kinase n=1 Tax=Halobaculum sp. MBLA0147 TaxID=3079934 RepID=UPI00352608D9